ncbi:hypothetical protein A5844_002500 [Enterococcus sp. 10A9_DIV0425]|uniref:DUF624 domain-containing protein n=1 Tax=Candidatus Enterococcus wittei TaxID=1987383 RepID=A0A242JVA0_9ENTE|nr:hypothetical protein A5844_002500 [Enterococcus sp. 10A9_DIV0425]
MFAVICIMREDTRKFGGDYVLGRALETLFIRIWVVMKLTLYFWVFTVIGGVVFGVGPAWKTINELFYHYGFEYKEITFKCGWQLFKKDFLRGSLLFGTFLLSILVLSYNLYLSVQIQGMLFLVIDFILLFGLFYAYTVYQYSMILDSEYRLSLINLLKLSLISSFSSFSTFLKIVIGNSAILWVTWNYKGLILFGLIGLLTVWNGLITKKWREELDTQLESYE